MVASIGFIFWGLLVVILDININQFDLLPDFIGYILAAIGTGGLIGASEQFATARKLCWALVVLSLACIVVRGDLGVVLGVIHLIINCTMMWFLLGGFMDLSLSNNRPDLAQKASNRRTVYIVLMCAATLIWFLAQASRDLAALAVVVIVVAGLVLVIMILHLIYQVKIVVGKNSNGPIEPPA
jgi:heme/copper-type cytochrome/quinol oxidase subunit 4